ncbi:hypothetical protein, partial [Limosilactobacillus fermentum]|uniref:hypothetical protein n=1 Tax=Limosilactobacillus fermentum TaxID=1613 RepID=UPI003164BCA2
QPSRINQIYSISTVDLTGHSAYKGAGRFLLPWLSKKERKLSDVTLLIAIKLWSNKTKLKLRNIKIFQD